MNAVDIYPSPIKQKGYIYIAVSIFLVLKGIARIGITLDIIKRENTYKCSDPTYIIAYYRDTDDKILSEKVAY